MKKIIKREEIKVNMPSKIVIGDPYYFESINEAKTKEEAKPYEKLIYNRGFRGKKNWVGIVSLVEEIENLYDEDNNKEIESLSDDRVFKSNSMALAFAEEEKYAKVLATGSYYARDKEGLVRMIGVDTAEYVVQFNDSYKQEEIIHTGYDGYVGQVIEFKNKTTNKLSGIIINLDLNLGFNQNLELIKRLVVGVE